MGHERDYSEEIASAIDEEVRRSSRRAHDEAWEILVEYRDVLDNLVLELMEKETLSRDQVLEIFAPIVRREQASVLRAATASGAVRPSAGPDAQGAGQSANGSALPTGGPAPRRGSTTAGAAETRPDRGRTHGEAAPGFDHDRIEKAVREILIAIGEDPDRDGLRDTPPGWPACTPSSSPASASGPRTSLTTMFDADHDEMVLVKDIEVYSTCEHHLVPFHGRGARRLHPERRAAGSPACRSWPGWSTSTPAGPRCRSG